MKKWLIWFCSFLAFLLLTTSALAFQGGTPAGFNCEESTIWDASTPILVRGLVQTPSASIYQDPNTATIITGQLQQGSPMWRGVEHPGVIGYNYCLAVRRSRFAG